MTWMAPAGHTGSQYSQWDRRGTWSWPLLVLEHQWGRWRSPGTHPHFPRGSNSQLWRTSRERQHLVKKRGFPAYLLRSLLFRRLVYGVLRIEQQGHVEKERRPTLGKVNLGDFIGQKLLILLDLNFSQSCLLRLTQPHGSTHHTGVLLKDTHHSSVNQHRGHVCSYIADADKLDDPIFKAHDFSFLLLHRRYSRCVWGRQHLLRSHETRLHKNYSVPFRHGVTSSSIFSLPHSAHTFSSFKQRHRAKALESNKHTLTGRGGGCSGPELYFNNPPRCHANQFSLDDSNQDGVVVVHHLLALGS